MIGYVCKYTPNLIIESFGDKAIRLDEPTNDFSNADVYIHPNMCTYVKSVLEKIIEYKIDKIVLVNCCDAVRRLYDVLKDTPSIKKIYMLDLPRKTTDSGINQFKSELDKFIKFCEETYKQQFNTNKLKELINNNVAESKVNKGKYNVALIGGRCNDFLPQSIKACGGTVIYNWTCTGTLPSYRAICDNEDVVRAYSEILLNSYPCMRMEDVSARYKTLKNDKTIDGIIYHTVKFCDVYSYEYAWLKDKVDVPMLKLETDYTSASEGQIKTRIEAFMESLVKGDKIISSNNYNKSTVVAGIDSGSTSTNVVLMNEKREIIAYSIVNTGAKSIEGAKKALNEALDKSAYTIDNIKSIVSTGYGRVSIPFADKNVTEITCHAMGVHYLNSDIRTIIDIGGQDSKAIQIDENGHVIQFAMNDKCAAGTGKFFEMMSRTLEIPINQMGKESLKWKEDITISSMCTVFAESEVISLIARNKEKADILHGLNKSITSKTSSLVERVKKVRPFMMTGGVAKNQGVVKCLEEKLGDNIIIPEEPQIAGAIGAAIFALDEIKL